MGIGKKKISFIVPVYRSKRFIKKNLEELKLSVGNFFDNFEIIVVVDGCKSSLLEVKKVEGIKILSYSQNRGKGFALKYGTSNATGEFITFIDADMDLHPDLLLNFIPYLSNADMVVGSKRHPFSDLEYPLMRKVFSKGFWFIQKIILGVALRDTQTGLKIIRRELADIVMPLVLVKRYAFDVELCFLAQKNGFRVVEAPVKVTTNVGSTIGGNNIFGLLKTAKGMFWDICAIRYRYSVLKYYQKKYAEERFK